MKKKIEDLNNIKTNWEKDYIILGIDEAGRGPTLGPMVYACAYWNKENQELIKKYFKFNDSKQLTEKEREKMFSLIEEYPNIISYERIIISPEEISKEMLKRVKVSLNEISKNAALELIKRTLRKKVNLKEIYVDTVGDPEKYKNYLKGGIGGLNIEIKVEPKADSKYLTVSGASIVAKVTRDNMVKAIKCEDNNYGSGYTSDPYTKKWLQNNFIDYFGYEDYIRFSWSTIEKVFKQKKFDAEYENYDENEEKDKRKYKHGKIDNNKNLEIKQAKLTKETFFSNYCIDYCTDL